MHEEITFDELEEWMYSATAGRHVVATLLPGMQWTRAHVEVLPAFLGQVQGGGRR